MAEIRKHNPDVGNTIAQALKAAMGEPVRPSDPGQDGTKASAPAPKTAAPTSIISVNVTTKVVHLPVEDDPED